MERYLTRKARPFWLLQLAEGLAITALLIWLAAGVYVFFDEFIRKLDVAVVLAFLILYGIPLWVLILLIRTWRRRRKARKIAGMLAWEKDNMVAWARMDEYLDMSDSQHLVRALCEKKYLRNMEPEAEHLMLQHGQEDADAPMQARKCPMCGAQLERRTFGDWACRYCGTVAGK